MKAVEAKEAASAPAPAKTAAAPAGETLPPLDPLLAKADPEAGHAYTKKICIACHNFAEGAGAKVGPDLYGVVGPRARQRARLRILYRTQEQDRQVDLRHAQRVAVQAVGFRQGAPKWPTPACPTRSYAPTSSTICAHCQRPPEPAAGRHQGVSRDASAGRKDARSRRAC